MFKAYILFFLTLHFPRSSYADIVWPLYNQQCQDDAGTRFVEDSQYYPNGFYHDNSAATPVLQNGECPDPLKQACELRPTYKTAYLEGPIDCGDNGWYCRIMPDENWPPVNLISDVNFGHCNTTDGFDDAGYDQDGHCHGSSVDSTYYWWVRDHFFRQYNGRLRCCCGWYEGTSSTPMYGGRIANRCDYRRLVTEDEPLEDCRDANEDHGLGFDDIGCDPDYKSSQLNVPIPEDDGICWEVQKFGFTEDGGGGDDDSKEDDDVSEDDDSDISCSDSSLRFRLKWKNKNVFRDCDWVAGKKTGEKCEIEGVSEICPVTCGKCSSCDDSSLGFKVEWNGDEVTKRCTWIGKGNTKKKCKIDGVYEACRSTCGGCN